MAKEKVTELFGSMVFNEFLCKGPGVAAILPGDCFPAAVIGPLCVGFQIVRNRMYWAPWRN